MEILLQIVLLIMGIVLIAKGGDWFVNSAIWLARVMNIPEMIIGATIVSVGTTLPELFTSITSVCYGLIDSTLAESYNSIAVGNSVGSMMCNMGLILGIVIAVKPVIVDKDFKFKGLFLLAVSLLLTVTVVFMNKISLSIGIILLILFAAFIAMNLAQVLKRNKNLKPKLEQSMPVTVDDNKWLMITYFIIGAVAIALGANLLVTNTKSLCIAIGIPTQIVSVTVVAIGTSLPELVTNITALRKGKSDLGVGNVIGANIINGTLLLGVITCITGGLPIDKFTANIAMWGMLAITAVMIIPTLLKKKTFRIQGVILLLIYIIIIALNVIYIL